jgi:hypothetical protein
MVSANLSGLKSREPRQIPGVTSQETVAQGVQSSRGTNGNSEWFDAAICDKQAARSKYGNAHPKRGTQFLRLLAKQETVLWEIGLPRRWHEPCLFKVGAGNQRTIRLKTTIINL